MVIGGYGSAELGHQAARTLLIRKAERPRDDSLRLETIITSRAAPRDVLVWSHQLLAVRSSLGAFDVRWA
jgi:hypothetical protein